MVRAVFRLTVKLQGRERGPFRFAGGLVGVIALRGIPIVPAPPMAIQQTSPDGS